MQWLMEQWLRVHRYVRETSGVSTVEYALIVVAVIGIVGAGITIIGGGFDALFEELAQEMDNTSADTLKAVTNAVKKGN